MYLNIATLLTQTTLIFFLFSYYHTNKTDFLKKYLILCIMLVSFMVLRNTNINPFNLLLEPLSFWAIGYNATLSIFLSFIFFYKNRKKILNLNLDKYLKILLLTVIILFFINLISYLNAELDFKMSFLNSLYFEKFIIILSFFYLFDNYFYKNKDVRLFKLLFKNTALLSNKDFYVPIFFGLLCTEVSYEYIVFMASTATNLASALPITDQIHNLLPKIDTSFIHVGVYDLVKYFSFLLLLFFVRYIPFFLFSTVVLSTVRATFIVMTNLGSPAGQPLIDSPYTFGGDLFFSGHVAMPFLWALIFWENKYLRYFFFLASFVFGIAALLGRFHYSIDVFSAPFFAYGVYVISQHLFPEYFNMTKGGENLKKDINI